MSKILQRSRGRFALTPDHDKAVRLFAGGQRVPAEAAFRQLLAKNRADIHALYHLAVILHTTQRHTEALVIAERGVQAAPGFAPVRAIQASTLHALGRLKAADAAYDKAIHLQPDYTEALLNSGVLRREMFQHRAALARFMQLLQVDPDHQHGLFNAASLVAQLEQPETAIGMFERLAMLNPDYPEVLGMLSYHRMRICDWAGVDALTQQMRAGVAAGRRVCRTFALMAVHSNAREQCMASRMMAAGRFPVAPQALWNGERYHHTGQNHRLRLAYISPDFREHPVSHLMSGVFALHDRSRFETIAISIGVNDHSPLRQQLERSFDKFIDLAGQGSLQVAQQIRALEVDILIDLAGYTADARPEILAHRPAPLQVNFLGFPGSMGTPYHDVILADRHVIPPEHQAFFSERVVHLPDAYLPTDSHLQVAERTPTRAECGLPDTGLVLCAFSHNFKIHPAMFGVWMRLLLSLPGSVLWLAGRSGPMRANLEREAAARGVDAARLVFTQRVPKVEDHLARYRLADIFLDTAPYNAHTTAADALWVGLPVLTLQGDAFPGRVAASLLHAIGLPELITTSLEGYEALALRLLRNPEALAALKARLAANRSTHALFDTPRFTRHLEATLLRLHAGQTEHAAADAAPPAAAAPAPAPASAPAPTSTTASAPTASPPTDAARRLHIGGKQRKAGWEVLNALPGPAVDHLGNANDLSRFADGSFQTVYASHVVEHFDYRDELHRTLSEWLRVLAPGGVVEISVPDMDVLCALMLDKSLSMLDHFKVMMMMFGGHVDAYDHHKVGLTAELLTGFLLTAGFTDVQRVPGFGHFDDTSDKGFAGHPISLNMRARKPGGW